MTARDDFLELFLRHQDDLRAFLGAMVRDADARADLFQDVALTLWKQIDTYDPTRSFGAWARGVAAKKVLQMREKSARSPVVFSPQTVQAILDAYDRTEREGCGRAAALRECLARLPERSRQLLAWRYEEDLPGDELARRVGATLDAVYQALSRLRGRLEECIRLRLAAQERGA
jgi:RNA polymerase sigma-70 factor, ECF subfamily